MGRARPSEDTLPAARLSVAAALRVPDARGFARALAPRPFLFPADHGSHPDYRTEWWYYTGNLAARDGRRFGFQLTFFRTALGPGPAPAEAESPEGSPRHAASESEPSKRSASTTSPEAVPSARSVAGSAAASGPISPAGPAASAGGRTSAWATRQVWFAHFAVTDAAGHRFLAYERWERQALGLAGADAQPFRVWVGPWSAASAGAGAGTGTGLAVAGTPPMHLSAATDEAAIDLVLTTALPPVPQGDRGLSAKSAEPGNASYYYSLPRLAAAGTLRLGAEQLSVTGQAWMDREWSTSSLAAGEVGWDWFGLQLDDGWELMLYRLRRRPPAAPAGAATPLRAPATGESRAGHRTEFQPAVAEQADPASLATLIAPDGRTTRLPLSSVQFAATGAWTSPASHARYPSGWRLRLPGAGSAALDLTVQPLLAAQELLLSFRYWEGAVTATGTHGGRPVTARGYVELTGYGDAPQARASAAECP
ncbi:MAG TPA: lipocalin-like domain-containing protein [Thermoanaerobaculia bacterium]|nr:lipocalin-like domain-containing protein [Thermoanaerobaculia bacterium]